MYAIISLGLLKFALYIGMSQKNFLLGCYPCAVRFHCGAILRMPGSMLACGGGGGAGPVGELPEGNLPIRSPAALSPTTSFPDLMLQSYVSDVAIICFGYFKQRILQN